MRELIEQDRACLILSRKRDARGIAIKYPKKTVLFTLANQDFRYNPIEGAEDLPLTRTNAAFAQALCDSGGLMLGSENYLLTGLAELNELLGTKEGKRQPSLFELLEWIKRRRHSPYSRDARFQESVTNRLEGLLFTLGKVFAVSAGLPIENCLRDGLSVVLELDGVNDHHALFVTISLITRVFSWGIHSATCRQDGVHVFLDDSQDVFSILDERRPDAGLSTMGLMAARFRTAGLLAASTQVPSLTAKLLRNNASTKILMRMDDAEEALAAARSVGIPDQHAIALMRLQPGHAIVFKSSCPYPVHVKVEYDKDLDV